MDRFVVLQPGQTRAPLPPGFTVKATTKDTEGRVVVMENQLNIDVPEHVHERMDELVYVLEGEMEIDFRGETHRLSKGMFAVVPMGIPHAMRNVSDPPVRALQISSPGGWDEFLHDMFGAGPALRTEDGQMDLAKVNEIGEKYGMRYTSAAMGL